MIAPQTSNVLVLEIAGAKSSSSELMIGLMGGESCIVGTVDLVDCRFVRSWSRWPSAVTMESGRKRVIFVMLRPGQVRKLKFSIARRKVQGVGLKQHPWRYCISSVFVLSLVMMASALCWKGFLIGMSQSPSSGSCGLA